MYFCMLAKLISFMVIQLRIDLLELRHRPIIYSWKTLLEIECDVKENGMYRIPDVLMCYYPIIGMRFLRDKVK